MVLHCWNFILSKMLSIFHPGTHFVAYIFMRNFFVSVGFIFYSSHRVLWSWAASLVSFDDKISVWMFIVHSTLSACLSIREKRWRPPTNHIMGGIIYKENYNLTKAKVEKAHNCNWNCFILRAMPMVCQQSGQQCWWRRRQTFELFVTVVRRFWRRLKKNRKLWLIVVYPVIMKWNLIRRADERADSLLTNRFSPFVLGA